MSRASQGWVASRCQRRLLSSHWLVSGAGGICGEAPSSAAPSTSTRNSGCFGALVRAQVPSSSCSRGLQRCSECMGLGSSRPRPAARASKKSPVDSGRSPLRQVPATTRQPATHEFPPCHAPFPPSKSHENSPRLPAVHQNVSSTLAHHRSCDRHRRRRCCGHPRYASHVASSRTPTTHSSSPLRSARSLKVPRD